VVAARPPETSLGALVKPRLRGVSHQIGFFLAVPVGILLAAFAGETARARFAAVVFATTVAIMFGASALYHRPTWTPRWRAWLRRLDHAGIYGLIAGTYTPFGLLVLDGAWRITVLSIVWGGALAAIVLGLAWASAPKWLAASIGIVLGWVGVVVFPQLVDRIGLGPSLLLLAGGVSYTLGAVVYALRKPDPVPAVFGYHELFHALVVVAVAFQYVVIAFFVLPKR
jgi:hemolysin III